MEGPTDGDFCCVCHENFNVPCQANCSHWFCGNCIIQVWENGSALQPCKCPLCRRPITLLIPTEDSLRQRDDPAVGVILGSVESYNRLYGGPTTAIGLFQRIRDLPFLLRRLVRELVDPSRSLPLVIRARVFIAMILSIVYVVSPIDIIPEALLGIVGLLDDLVIVLIFFLHVAALYRAVLYNRHRGT